jgi:hypothetical protein
MGAAMGTGAQSIEADLSGGIGMTWEYPAQLYL